MYDRFSCNTEKRPPISRHNATEQNIEERLPVASDANEAEGQPWEVKKLNGALASEHERVAANPLKNGGLTTMPRHKSPESRKIILPIRFNEIELNELAKRAVGVPLSTWIRKRALEVSQPSQKSPDRSEPLPPPPLEGGVPARLPGETYKDYERRLNHWSVATPNDRDLRLRLELATAALVKEFTNR